MTELSRPEDQIIIVKKSGCSRSVLFVLTTHEFKNLKGAERPVGHDPPTFCSDMLRLTDPVAS